MIYILTGDVRSGKTTALLNWSKNRTDVDGLLCPDGEDGKRYFLKVKSKESFPLEVEAHFEAEEIVPIGPFKFLKSAFNEANNALLEMAAAQKSNYLISDEHGKLELKNEGLFSSAKTLIPDFEHNENKHLILVVREYLLDEIISYYNIENYTVLSKADLETLELY